MAHGRLPGSTSKQHAVTARPPSRGRGRTRTAGFCLRSLGSLWFWFDNFPRKGRGRARRRSGGRGRLPTYGCCHSFLTEKVHAVAKSTLPKVQILRCRKGQSPTTLSEVGAVQSPTLSKKKKSNFAGFWLDRACESEASDSSGRVPWPGRIETRARHVPGPVTGIWLVSFRTFS